MQYRFNLLVVKAYTILQCGEQLHNIKKCNLRCAHTQAHHNTPEKKMAESFKHSEHIKCQWSNCISHRHK
jgi:hypothetical protein